MSVPRETSRTIYLAGHSTADAGAKPPVADSDAAGIYYEKDTDELLVSTDAQPWTSLVGAGAQTVLPEGMTGAELSQALVNAATDPASDDHVVVIPVGLYTIDAPIVLARAGAGNYVANLEVRGAVKVFPGLVSQVRIQSSYNDGPIFALQGTRAVTLAQLNLLGQNDFQAAIPTVDSIVDDSVMLLAGVRNNRYSPHCGIAWDPFLNGAPGGVAANRYPALTAYYVNDYAQNTSGGGNYIENVACQNLAVGIVNSPSGSLTSGDNLSMRQCYFQTCRIGYASGNGQNKTCVLEDSHFLYGLHRVDCVSFGAQQGAAPEERGGDTGWCKLWHNVHHSIGVGDIAGGFMCEAMHALGQFGFGASSVSVTVSLRGREVNLWNALAGKSVDVHAVTLRPIVITGATFGMQDSGGGANGTYRWHNDSAYFLVFDSCQFLAERPNGHLPIDFNWPETVEMRRCWNRSTALHGIGQPVSSVQVGGGPTNVTFLSPGKAQFTIVGAGAALDIGDHVGLGTQYAPRQYAPGGVPFNTACGIGTVTAKAGDTITLSQVPETIEAMLPINDTVFRRRHSFA